MAGFGQARREAYDKVQGAQYYRSNLLGLNAFERHKRLCHDYLAYYAPNPAGVAQAGTQGPGAAPGLRTDADALREQHRFIRTADDNAADTWEVRLAKKYYDRLFREYCIADTSRYKESKLGLRWRTQKEVVSGKGQFICGAKGCEEKEGLCSYEVNFAYVEAGERRQALVKLRVCPSCAYRINYRKEQQYRKSGGGDGDGRKRRRASDGGSGGEEAVDPMVRKAMEFVERYAQGLTPKDIALAARDVAPPPTSAAGAGGSTAGAAAGSSEPHDGAGTLPPQLATMPADMSVWESKPVQEATAEEEFDAYLEGMFL